MCPILFFKPSSTEINAFLLNTKSADVSTARDDDFIDDGEAIRKVCATESRSYVLHRGQLNPTRGRGTKHWYHLWTIKDGQMRAKIINLPLSCIFLSPLF